MLASETYPVLIHLHIPKTAGTAVRDAVKRSLDPSAYLEFYPKNPYNRLKSISLLREKLEAKPNVKFISGHFVFGIHEALGHDKYKYFTVLRDPVARFLSHYHHSLRHNLHRIESEMARRLTRWDLRRIAQDSSIGFFYNNKQTLFALGLRYDKKKSDEENPERLSEAFREIKTNYIGLYSSDHFDNLKRDVSAFLNIGELQIREENTAGRFQPPQLLSEDTMATLRAANFLDVALMQMCDLDSDISVPCADTPATDDRYQLVLNEQLREAAFRLSERCKKLEKG